MVGIEASIISLGQCHEHVSARARALTPDVGAEIWIKVEFERSTLEPWEEARDRVLAVLDPA